MSEYDIKRFTTDFIDRTNKNYEFICKEKNINGLNGEASNSVYEVTQLVNSLFGVIVIPCETYFSKRCNENIIEKLLEEDKNYSLEPLIEIEKMIFKAKSQKRFRSTYKDGKNNTENKFYKLEYTYDDTYKRENKRFIWFDNMLRFIKHLRNALSHSGNTCLYFFRNCDYNASSEDVNITDIVFLDMSNGAIFAIQLSIDEIIKLKDLVANFFVTFEEKNVIEKIVEYEDAKKQMTAFFEEEQNTIPFKKKK